MFLISKKDCIDYVTLKKIEQVIWIDKNTFIERIKGFIEISLTPLLHLEDIILFEKNHMVENT